MTKKEVGRCSNSENYYVVDLAATLRTAKNLPATFEDLAMKLLQDIPATYKVVYFACDTYKANSIKGAERKKRCPIAAIIQDKSTKGFSDFFKQCN